MSSPITEGYQMYNLPPAGEVTRQMSNSTAPAGSSSARSSLSSAGAGAGGASGGASDPFSYTGGSLLTPWTREFSYTGAPSGGGAAPMDPFSYANLNYSFSGPRNIDTPDAYRAATFDPGDPFRGAAPFEYGAYNAPANFNPDNVDPREIAGPANPFSYGNQLPSTANLEGMGFVMPERYTAASPFVAPDINETNDPGYAFRLEQGKKAALANFSSQGVRGGDVLKALNDYAQNTASAEYGNVFNRALGAYQTNEGNRLAAFNADTGAQLQGQGQRWGQAIGLYNAQAQNQQAGFQQAFDTNAFNTNTSIGVQQANAANNLQADLANVNNRFNAAGLNSQNALNAYQTNYGVASGNYDRNNANAFRDYQANFDNRFSAAQFDASQALSAAQLNSSNSLQAQIANAQNDLGAGSLGWQIASGSYDRNRQNALEAYQMDAQQRAAAAAGGASSEREAYNRAMQQYQMQYGIFQDNQANQYNRLMGMSQLGLQSAGMANQYAGAYGNAYGDYTTGAGNSQAAAAAASGSAWSNFANSAAGAVGNAFLYGSPMNPYNRPPRVVE